MLRTYEGTLKGNRIDWRGDAPASEGVLRVHVTVLDEADDDEQRGRRMAEALERLAEREAFEGIENPSAWQRAIRNERSLPGRDGG